MTTNRPTQTELSIIDTTQNAPATEREILQEAAVMLSQAPFYWDATVEHPGYLLVIVSKDCEPRYYAAGFANPMLGVDHVTADGAETGLYVDTGVACRELDAFRLAIHVAAAIDRMEHD